MKSGKWKIFLGILPGAGKMHAVLRAVGIKAEGATCVTACCNYSETAALLEKITVIPSGKIEYSIRCTRAGECMRDAERIASYVESKRVTTEKEKKQPVENSNLVEQSGGDLAEEYRTIARRKSVFRIIAEKVGKKKTSGNPGKSGNINTHISGSEINRNQKHVKNVFRSLFSSISGKYTLVILAAFGVALLTIPITNTTGYLFLPLVFLLAAFVMAVNLKVGIFLLSGILIVLAWIIFFVSPRFSLQIDTFSDLFLFVTFFIIALLNGIFALRFKEQEVRMIARERQTNALFLLSQKLGNASNIDEVVNISMENIRKYFSDDAFFIFMDDNARHIEQKYIPSEVKFTETDMANAVQASKTAEITGQSSDSESSSKYIYYPLKGVNLKSGMGVVAVRRNKPREGESAVFWDAFLTQIAQAVEHQYMGQLTSKTNLLNESDKLYKTLFNSISHELRIPVASIMGASDLLLTTHHPERLKTELYGEILDASKRLNRLIGNLLDMSRLDAGRIAVNADWCDIHDLFHLVTEELKEELQPFKVDISVPETIPPVMLDFGLMERVLYNLVYNSTLYAPPETTIRLKASYDDNCLLLQVTDRGPGFEPKDLPHVFDKFWRYKADKTGGLGLGLSIVKGFVEAHKGSVIVENRKNGGTCFTIKIPVKVSQGNS